jgi:hypothetical protein
MSTRPRTALLAGCAGFLVLTLSAASAAAGTSTGLRFSRLPGRAIAGGPVTIAVAQTAGEPLCALSVHYAGGAMQQGLQPARAVGQGASWSWSIPDSAQAGMARLTVSCADHQRLSGQLLVVGSLIAPRISVEKDGFSVRAHSYGGSDVSYGVILRNHSPNADALNVNVLVNFVLGNGHLLGSASTTVPAIAAGSSYPLGSNLGFPGAAPIARLEVVVQVKAHARHTGHPPALDNILIEPSTTDQGWVNDVAGELINNDSSQLLQNAQLSAVIFDAQGNILGGGSGSTYNPLPPGTRVVFKLTSRGFSDIPVEKAASAMVSAIPAWKTAGAA